MRGMIDEAKGRMAILRLREARKAVRESGAEVGCWIVKDLEMHIGELQKEVKAGGEI